MVDYGTNTVPNPLPNTAPTNIGLHAVYTYDNDGFLQNTTDPDGVVTHRVNDPLGRVVVETDNFIGDGTNHTSSSNRVTEFDYNGANEQKKVTAYDVTPTGTVPEVTNYYYGNGMDNSVLASITYPDNSIAYYTYDNLDELDTYTNRSNDTHTYTYDAMGRQTLDSVQSFGSNTDQTVKAIGTSYDTLGDVLAQTSYSNAAGTGILNQASHEYNGLRQVTADFENPSGSAGSTPSVQYVYDQSGNYSRLIGEVYPTLDGTGAVVYGYSGSPVDDEISRVDTTAQGTADNSTGDLAVSVTLPLETENYLGPTLVAGRNLPQIAVTESTAMDSFGRIKSLDWLQTSAQASGDESPDLDQYQYSYDNDGQIQSRADDGGDSDISGDPAKMQSFVFNGLGNLTSFTSSTVVSNYELDSMGNRIYASATYNSDNQLTSSGQSYAGGNTTTLFGGGVKLELTYDAWGRVVKLVSSSVTAAALNEEEDFVYDALGRSVKETITYSEPEFGMPVEDSTTEIATYDAANHPVLETYSEYNRDEFGVLGTTPISEYQYQYIWSGSDDRLIRRSTIFAYGDDAPSSGTDQIYPLTDAQGNITSLVSFQTLAGQSSPSWQVVERENYNADGLATAYTWNWQVIPLSSNGTIGSFDWKFLWGGQQGAVCCAGYMLYSSPVGENWYTPEQARTLSPDPVTNPSENPYNRPYNIDDADASYSSSFSWLFPVTDPIVEYGVPIAEAGLTVAAFIPGLDAPALAALGLGFSAASFTSAYASGASGTALGVSTGISAALSVVPIAGELAPVIFDTAREIANGIADVGPALGRGFISEFAQPITATTFSFGSAMALSVGRFYSGIGAGIAELAPDELRMYQLIEMQEAAGADAATIDDAGEGQLYDVGTCNQLRYNSLRDTIIHHVLSRLRGRELLADFAVDRMAGTELGIRLPASEASEVDAAALLRPEIPGSARQELAWQIRDLRNFTNAPNSALQELIELHALERPWDFNVRGN